MKAVCVFCGSKSGTNPAHAEAARRFGRLLGERGIDLVFGGGGRGLMGDVSAAALEAGARVVGVIPRALVDREPPQEGLTELHLVGTMHERKALMTERSDALVALPGSLGTLEELFEALAWAQLGFHDKPVGMLNVAGYYDPLLAFLDGVVAEGFLREKHRGLLIVDVEMERLLDRLAAECGRSRRREIGDVANATRDG